MTNGIISRETAHSQVLRRMAKDFRANAIYSNVLWFSLKMNEAADELEVQAIRIEDAEIANQAALAWH